MPAHQLAGKRIAVVMMSAIGDAVHTLPVICSLRAAAPDVHISWIIQPAAHALVAGHPAVDDFVVFDRGAGVRGLRRLRREVAGRRFDLVLALQVYLKAGLVTALLRAPRKLGFDRARARDANWLFTTERIRARPGQHVQDQYFEFLHHLGVPVRLEWGLGPTAEERARYAALLPPFAGPTVALVVGTSKPIKEWPAERYAELADRVVREMGGRTVLVGGRSAREDEAAEMTLRRSAHPPLDLREWDLRRLVYLLDRSDVLVSPDTGPLHIGVALGTPSVALMGATDPRRVGPYRFRELVVDAFHDAGEAGAVTAERRDRMGRIDADGVAHRVRLALERYGRRNPGGHPEP